jgi:hypothetical protein
LIEANLRGIGKGKSIGVPRLSRRLLKVTVPNAAQRGHAGVEHNGLGSDGAGLNPILECAPGDSGNGAVGRPVQHVEGRDPINVQGVCNLVDGVGGVVDGTPRRICTIDPGTR